MKIKAWLLLILFLSSCSLPGQGDPPSLYRLHSLFEGKESPRSDIRLAVARPTASVGLDTSRIALSPAPLQIDYFARARWVQAAPDLIQNLLIESLRQRLSLVSPIGSGSRPHFLLTSELREFQVEVRSQSPPQIKFHLIWTLLDFPEKNWLATESMPIHSIATDESLPAIMKAFNEAWNRFLNQQLSRMTAHLNHATQKPNTTP